MSIVLFLNSYDLGLQEKELFCVRVVESEIIDEGIVHEFLFRSDSSIIFSTGGGRFTSPSKCWGNWYQNHHKIIISNPDETITYSIITLSELSFLIPEGFSKDSFSMTELKAILDNDWLRNTIKFSKGEDPQSTEPLAQIEFDLLRNKLKGLPIFIKLPIPETGIEFKRLIKKRKYKKKC